MKRIQSRRSLWLGVAAAVTVVLTGALEPRPIGRHARHLLDRRRGRRLDADRDSRRPVRVDGHRVRRVQRP